MGVYQSSQCGALPVLFFFHPGSKSTTGILSDEKSHPSIRGGLVRMADAPQMQPWGDWAELHTRDVRVVFESWQETAAQGGA